MTDETVNEPWSPQEQPDPQPEEPRDALDEAAAEPWGGPGIADAEQSVQPGIGESPFTMDPGPGIAPPSVSVYEEGTAPEPDASAELPLAAVTDSGAGSVSEAADSPAAGTPEHSDLNADYSTSFPTLKEGDVIQGTVVHIDREGVLVDVGTKSEGLIRRNELSRDPSVSADDIVKVGETIDVYVMETESQDGNLILSKKRADFEKAWERVQQAKDENRTIMAMVTDRVKGGLVVDLGIRGFVPASHVGNGSMKNNLERYVGQSIPLKVIEVDKERRKVVLSNKLAAEEDRETRRHETVSSLQPGQIRRGIVRRLTNYGAFVDLGGIDGLLHISEMSWTRINHPQEVLKEGQEIDVVVLKLDLDAGRVSLGLRQILPDPWTEIEHRYHVGDLITGTVTRIVPFGAFVQVEGGIEGIIPNSELSSRKGGKGAPPIQQGEVVEVKVIDVRPDERKMTLSLRQARQEQELRREREAVQEFQSQPSSREEPRYTIGDAFRARRRQEREEEEEEE